MTTNSKAVFPWVPASKGKTASVKFRENSNIVGGYGQEDNSAPAQRSRILSHLQCGPLTTLQARAIGIMHPAPTISKRSVVCAPRARAAVTTRPVVQLGFAVMPSVFFSAVYRLFVAHDKTKKTRP